MVETCPRCDSTLQPFENATPLFCSNCGLAQLRVSGDALVSPRADAPVAGTSDEPEVAWKHALRILGLCALVGTVPPMLLPGAVSNDEVGRLSLLLTPVLTMGGISAYYRSRPRRAMSPAIGARMGAVLGLMMGSLVAFVAGVAGFVLRYGRHSHAMDDRIQSAAQQMLQSMQGTQPPQEVVRFVQSPEFFAGVFILGHAITLLMLVGAAAVCGWIAGSVLRARRQRHIG